MKKAFTLLEIAIVLVIMGIILAMATKGKDLISTAHMKKEMNKFITIEKGLRNIINLTDSLPDRDSRGYYDLNELFNLGLIDWETYSSSYSVSGEQYYYGLVACGAEEDGRFFINPTISGVCITSMLDLNKDKAPDQITPTNNRFSCNLDLHLDDLNSLTGRARVMRGNIIESFDNCAELYDSERVYAFRIH